MHSTYTTLVVSGTPQLACMLRFRQARPGRKGSSMQADRRERERAPHSDSARASPEPPKRLGLVPCPSPRHHLTKPIMTRMYALQPPHHQRQDVYHADANAHTYAYSRGDTCRHAATSVTRPTASDRCRRWLVEGKQIRDHSTASTWFSSILRLEG